MDIEQGTGWVSKSKRIDDLDVEVCFTLRDTLYVGGPNSPAQLQDQQYYQPLEMPSFERVVPTLARTSEVLGNTEGLASYYKEVVERSFAIGRTFSEIRQYFWLDLFFWNKQENVVLSFPWYDHFSEIQRFFSWLNNDPEKPFEDADQGWQIQAVRIGDDLHIRQSDPDDGDEYDNIAVPFEVFAEKAKGVERRALEVIDALSEQLGVDVWSAYLTEASFGTEEWPVQKPKQSGGFLKRLFGRGGR